MVILRETYGVMRYTWGHPANRGQRLRGIARAIAFQVRGRMGARTLARIGPSGKMWAELHFTGSSNVLYANPPDWNEMQAWRKIIKAGDLFLDIGSNVGSYALWAGGLGARVVAIEPHPAAANRLRENVAMNPFEVEVIECALADATGSMALTTDLDTVNHLLVNRYATGRAVEVAVRTLDDLLGMRLARGAKIDVEGAERLVLAGAKSALTDHRIGVLQIEWNEMSQLVLGEDRQVVARLLESKGYRFFRPDEDGVLHPSSPHNYGADIFAVAPGHAPDYCKL